MATPQKNGAKHIGVTTVEGIKDRCRIDDITGCWNWAWGRSDHKNSANPAVHVGAGICGATRKTAVSAYRAAWLLAGKKIKDGHVVYRVCCNMDCCNPDHLKSGPRSEMYAHYAASGKNKGQPHRKLANAKNRQKMMVPAEKVREVEQLLSEGVLIKEIRKRMNMCGHTVRKIRDGVHPNSSSAGMSRRVLVGASIFNMGAM